MTTIAELIAAVDRREAAERSERIARAAKLMVPYYFVDSRDYVIAITDQEYEHLKCCGCEIGDAIKLAIERQQAERNAGNGRSTP